MLQNTTIAAEKLLPEPDLLSGGWRKDGICLSMSNVAMCKLSRVNVLSLLTRQVSEQMQLLNMCRALNNNVD